MLNPNMSSLCPYVQRISICYKFQTCQFCQAQQMLKKFMQAPQFRPAPQPVQQFKPLQKIDLDSYQVKTDVYKKVQFGIAPSDYSTPQDLSQAYSKSKAYPDLPSDLETKPDSLDKSNLTVQGTDGKRYSVAYLMPPPNSTAAPPAPAYTPPPYQASQPNYAYGVPNLQDFQNMMDLENQQFIESSQNCQCCQGFAYNCQGMRNGEISCQQYCYCLIDD